MFLNLPSFRRSRISGKRGEEMGLFDKLRGKDETSEIVQELLALKSKVSKIPQAYSTSALVFGAGAGKTREQIPTISAVIDDAVKALRKGLDVHNRPITRPQIADGLKRLIVATRRPAFIGLISTVIDPAGISELEKYMNEL